MSGDYDAIRAAMRGPMVCCVEVDRHVDPQECAHTAIALRRDTDGVAPYPVCANHAVAPAHVVPLIELAAALLRWDGVA